LIGTHLGVEEPEDPGLYLGCKRELSEKVVDGKNVKIMTYNMESYLTAIVKDYRDLTRELTGHDYKCKHASTPFLDDDHQSSLARAPASNPLGHPVCPWCKVPVDPNADTLDLTKVKSTDNKSVTDRPVNGPLTKRLIGWVGNTLSEVAPHTFADADFAGCPRTLRSTSGGQIQLEGTYTRFPLTARSIRQTCVATSIPDAELAAQHLAYKVMSLPALDLWEVLLGGPVVGIIHEDNTACIAVVMSGKNPTRKYIGRSQGINIQLLFEFLGTPNSTCPNELIRLPIFTLKVSQANPSGATLLNKPMFRMKATSSDS
jgi:hypothetical protein